MRGVLVAVAALALTACATNRAVLDPPEPSGSGSGGCAVAGPVSARQLARRLGMTYADADSHVLLTRGTARVRIWENSSEVSIAGETARLPERSRRRGRTLLVPASTARYVEARVGRVERATVASVRRPLRRAPAAVCAAPPPAPSPRPSAAPIRAPQPVIAHAPKTAPPDPRWDVRAAAPRPWRWIVIHHSDDTCGDFAKYDRIHRENNGWDECGYHFVIGNGSLSADGEVEIGSRWVKQKHGAHAKTPDNRFNDYGIGICLVGDFESGGRPTPAQMDALVRLCRYLMDRYGIGLGDVLGHCDCKPTACPGRHFPWAELRSRLSQPSV